MIGLWSVIEFAGVGVLISGMMKLSVESGVIGNLPAVFFADLDA